MGKPKTEALRQAQSQRYEALKNALNTVQAFAIPSLPPQDFEDLQRVKKSLLKKYKPNL